MGAGATNAVGWGVAGVGSHCGGWLGEMAKRVAKEMFPVSNCRGYISFSHASGEQACSATLQAVRKEWQSLSSSSMASLSMSCILSPCDCCRVWVQSAQAASTSLIAVVHVASASWIVVA